jgi:putative PIN family toxin of toxin-antitoxin system
MFRVVVDTSVIVAALRSASGASNALLREIARGRVIPLVSPALFLEYEDVLKRPEHRLVHGLSLPAVDQFLATFADATEPVTVNFSWRPLLTDPNDEMLIEVAINARAYAIVTHNVKDFVGVPEQFAVRVLNPGELLMEMQNE